MKSEIWNEKDLLTQLSWSCTHGLCLDHKRWKDWRISDEVTEETAEGRGESYYFTLEC